MACGTDGTHLGGSDSGVPVEFRKVTLDADVGEPMGLAVLPSGAVLQTTRDGRIWLHAPSGGKGLAAELDVYTHDEDGLQGIAIDPEFEQNRWVYVYYSPRLSTPEDDPGTVGVDEGQAPEEGTPADWAPFSGHLRLARFLLESDRLELESEQVILEVPTERGICCHVGGQIDFDGEGNLYLSTGDDTEPFQSDGYTPIDERPSRNPAFDAQRSAGNTNDLRGKLLRISVAEDGSYTIPDGNLFAPGTPATRPEIYLMGLRNPFRFAVDRRSGDIYLADYAPDAAADLETRGPAGTGRWMRVTGPGNYGWPYCTRLDLPYVDFDFESRTSGMPFDCAMPLNDSPNNTGARQLPPTLGADIEYTYRGGLRHPELGPGGIGPMAGPAYVFDEASASARKWPREYDGAPLFYDWVRDLVRVIRFDEQGQVGTLEAMPWGFKADNPIDMEFGPDGALYVLEYGDGYYSANSDAQLSRIDYIPGSR